MYTTSLCSVVFVGFTAHSNSAATKQNDETLLFSTIVNDAVQHLEQSDRFILHASSGIAISLIGKVEDGLLVALAIKEAIATYNKTKQKPLQVGIAVNLCAVQVVKDVNLQFKMIGDAIKGAQLIMSFAEADQVLASRSYYEAISTHAQSYRSQFSYFFEIKQDKQHKNYEVYQLGKGYKKTSDKSKLSKLERTEKLKGLQTFDDLETFKGLQAFETLENKIDTPKQAFTKAKPSKRAAPVKVDTQPAVKKKDTVRLVSAPEVAIPKKKDYLRSALPAIGVLLVLLLLNPVKKFFEARQKPELSRKIETKAGIDRQNKISEENSATGYANEPLEKKLKLKPSKVLRKNS